MCVSMVEPVGVHQFALSKVNMSAGTISRRVIVASMMTLTHYVDIFYSHRFDPTTPLEETLGALDAAVRQGEALYVGVSSYSAEHTSEAIEILKRLSTPLLIHQPSYSMLNRWIKHHLLDLIGTAGLGCIAFSPLAQGLLTDKYLDGIPSSSRVRTGAAFSEQLLTEENLARVRSLNEIAARRGQSLAQLAIAWTLRDPRVTSALIGSAVSDNSRRTSPRSAGSISRQTSWWRSIATLVTARSTSGHARARADAFGLPGATRPGVRARLPTLHGLCTETPLVSRAAYCGQAVTMRRIRRWISERSTTTSSSAPGRQAAPWPGD
jgi:diketogulonate reductase-like aldo/keto reductase